MLMMPKTVPEWIKWKFMRYNGPPKKYALHELQIDAEYDLLNYVDLNKKELSTELKSELDSLVDTGFLTKENDKYIGDHYREDSKAYQRMIDESDDIDSEDVYDPEEYKQMVDEARARCRESLSEFKDEWGKLGVIPKMIISHAEQGLGMEFKDWGLDEWIKLEYAIPSCLNESPHGILKDIKTKDK